jgi:hypothetical protein
MVRLKFFYYVSCVFYGSVGGNVDFSNFFKIAILSFDPGAALIQDPYILLQLINIIPEVIILLFLDIKFRQFLFKLPDIDIFILALLAFF